MPAKVGDIVKIDDPPGIQKFGDKPKKKFGILVSLGKNWYFYINSENRSMYDCIPLNVKSGRTFPYHDSFIGCHRPFAVDSAKIKNSPISSLDKTELEALLVKVQNSERLSLEQIKEISENLTQAIQAMTPASVPPQ